MSVSCPGTRLEYGDTVMVATDEAPGGAAWQLVADRLRQRGITLLLVPARTRVLASSTPSILSHHEQ